jgi:hypothetical protein
MGTQKPFVLILQPWRRRCLLEPPSAQLIFLHVLSALTRPAAQVAVADGLPVFASLCCCLYRLH